MASSIFDLWFDKTIISSVLGKKKIRLIVIMMMVLVMLITTGGGGGKAAGRVDEDQGFSCPVVIKSIASCGSFLSTSTNTRPSEACCAAAKKLDNQAMQSSAADRIDLCFCLSIVGQDSVPSHAYAFKSLCKLTIVKIVPENQCL